MEKNDAPASQLVLNQPAPEIYVSGIVRGDIEWGNIVKLTFASLHMSGDGKETHQVVNLRLVMGAQAAHGLVDFLTNWMKNVNAVTQPVSPGTTPH